MNRVSGSWFSTRLLVAAFCLSLLGCATQLAPQYDKVVVDGLGEANTQTMTLLAAASQGADKSTFPAREPQYNALIGKLEALAIAAGARPMPKNKVADAINKALEKRSGKALDDDDATPPSAYAIRKIADTMTKMRDTDRKQGVTAYEAQAFKGQAAIYFDQALTYENFLQR
jgi:hypothetical protein